MDLNTRILLSLVTVLAMNHVVVRFKSLRRFSGLFWAVFALDIVCGSLVLWFGLPGFEKMYPVTLMMGLLMFYHASVNLKHRAEWLREERRERLEAENESLLASLHQDADD